MVSVERFAVRRLKSTVIEMASLRDAVQRSILCTFAGKICLHTKFYNFSSSPPLQILKLYVILMKMEFFSIMIKKKI